MSEVRPVLAKQEAIGRSSSPEDRRDAAFALEVENLVGFARLMLQPPSDLLDSPMVRQRRQDAALAALDVLWASLAEKNTREDQATAYTGLVGVASDTSTSDPPIGSSPVAARRQSGPLCYGGPDLDLILPTRLFKGRWNRAGTKAENTSRSAAPRRR